MMPATTEPLVLRIERTFNAPRARVFAAWTNPDIIRQWSAPAGAHVAEGEGDVIEGGRWRVLMINDTTGERYEAVGTYLEVVPPARLRYTHAWLAEGESFDDAMQHATIVTMELHDAGNRTRMVFVQEGFVSAASRDGHESGWTSCFTLLDTVLEPHE
jgi:uncharacterized protein YndB with AHSA1/START domain